MSVVEDIRPEEEPRSFKSAKPWKRAIVLSAGSVTHFITAFAVLILVFMAVGVPNPDRPTLEIEAVSEEVAGEPSPAIKAGLKPGDRIVSIDGTTVRDFEAVRDAIVSSDGGALAITVLRDGDRRTLEMTPRIEEIGDEKRPIIGVLPLNETQRFGPIESVQRSWRVVDLLLFGAEGQPGFFGSLPRAFSPSSLGLSGDGPTEERPFSIVGAGRIAADFWSAGRILDFLLLFVQINLFVGIFNLLPFPPLDGGHLLFLLIEKIRGKAVDQRIFVSVAAVVFGLLTVIGILLLYYDIVQPPQIPNG